MICRDLRTFWKTLGKNKVFFGRSKTVFLGTALLHDIYCILYTEVNLQVCKNAQKITNIGYACGTQMLSTAEISV